MVIILEVLFLLLNIVIAKIHAQRFNANIAITNTFHAIWAGVVGAFIVGAWFLSHHNWWLVLALTLLRMWAFNPILNYLRIPRKPFFYLHGESQNGSFIDTLQEQIIGNNYPYFWAGYVVAFIVTQFFI